VRLMSGDRTTEGQGMIEIYEYDNRFARLTNLSSRAWVGRGSQLAIPGVVIRGTAPKRLLVRAVGPGLAKFGVQDVLSDPRIELRSADGRTIAANNDWEIQPGVSEVSQASAAASVTITVAKKGP